MVHVDGMRTSFIATLEPALQGRDFEWHGQSRARETQMGKAGKSGKIAVAHVLSTWITWIMKFCAKLRLGSVQSWATFLGYEDSTDFRTSPWGKWWLWHPGRWPSTSKIFGFLCMHWIGTMTCVNWKYWTVMCNPQSVKEITRSTGFLGCRALALFYHFQLKKIGIGITSGRTYPSSVAHPSLQATKDGSSGPSRRLETGRSRARGQLQGGMAGQLWQSETCPGRPNATSLSEHLIMTYEKIAIENIHSNIHVQTYCIYAQRICM